MHDTPSLIETYEQIVREEQPNFLRLYLNPHVAQTCFCLDRYMKTTWIGPSASTRLAHAVNEDCQSFLANSIEEALSGAIKLARYSRHRGRARSTGLVLDPADRLAGFVCAQLKGGFEVEFLPGLIVAGRDELTRGKGVLGFRGEGQNGQAEIWDNSVDLLVLVAGPTGLLERHAEGIRRLVRRSAPVVITCVDRATLAALRTESGGILREIVPDIVVFDESFVNHAVPFGAFTAHKSLFACWNRPGKATFHSTTFQPNTISTLHFMRSLAAADPGFYDRYRASLDGVRTDPGRRGDWFRRYYHPALFRLIRTTGFDTGDVRAAGSFVIVDGRRIFDGVSGVACSFRGHNPTGYLDEMKRFPSLPAAADRSITAGSIETASTLEAELRRRLCDLTGLESFVPAVSGATAVENALKIALIAQYPKRQILALKAGFGGKTLFALTGTANRSYKERLDPLYGDVHYVDAFAVDACAQIESLLATGKVAVVQVELVQGVGGVRRAPEKVIRLLEAGRKEWGYLLLVDEVQTGMYRTGAFTMSQAIGLVPDLLLLGKATTDMMFPFALALYSARVEAMVERQGSDLERLIQKRYGYEQGYKTVLNVLRLGEEWDMPRKVTESAALVEQLLRAGLGSNKIVRDIRVFGLLIGIELDTRRWPQRWLHKRLSSFHLFNMMRHHQFPVLGGFCQYEPNVLKITPPLNASPDEIRQLCATVIDVLNRPLPSVLAAGLRGLIHSSSGRRKNREYRNSSALEPVAR